MTLSENAQANVVRPAPEIPLRTGDKVVSLKAFRGQPVVVVFGESPSTSAWKRQVKELETMYDHFASSKVLFVAAFSSGTQEPVTSNIPFLVTPSGKATCDAYGVSEKFAIAIIGADGNLDYLTRDTLHASRVREVLKNSYTVQQADRRR